MSFPPSTLC